jgi:hypothetical protein
MTGDSVAYKGGPRAGPIVKFQIKLKHFMHTAKLYNYIFIWYHSPYLLLLLLFYDSMLFLKYKIHVTDRYHGPWLQWPIKIRINYEMTRQIKLCIYIMSDLALDDDSS